jgi:gliding motility-associated-like protein
VKDTTVYIHIDVVPCTEVYIPNIFTPNGDGRNDIFFVKTEMELKSFEMVVYSSNGQQLFLSKDITRGWDGTYKGQPQPHGLYFYTVRYIDNLGKSVEKGGELLLILQ